MTYLGKRVEAKVFARGEQGRLTTEKTTIVGICMREPREPGFLFKNFYTVIDRMPVELESLDDIKLKE